MCFVFVLCGCRLPSASAFVLIRLPLRLSLGNKYLDTRIREPYSVNKEKLSAYKKALAACTLLKEKGLVDFEATPVYEAHEAHCITITWNSPTLDIDVSDMPLLINILAYGDGCMIDSQELFVCNVITEEI